MNPTNTPYDDGSYEEVMEAAPQADVALEENGNMEEKKNRFPYKTINEFGGRIKRKRNPHHKHQSVKRFVAPKNALMCLMEAHAGINFVEESVTAETHGNVFTMSVKVNGTTYSGSGHSKDAAKHAAAEAALAGFVRHPEDNSNFTPWSSIASFAMYKLFNEWKCCIKPTPSQPIREENTNSTDANIVPKLENSTDTSIVSKLENSTISCEDITPMDKSLEKSRKPAKQVPEGATSMNPVMLLHQMRPTVAYQTLHQVEQNQSIFTLTTILDEQQYTGTAKSMKKAKFELAKEAVKSLFNIESTWNSA